jgi:Holliday junction DNA helicase RuvA
MIAQLTGSVLRKDAASLVLDVNGVGYLVFVPSPLLESSAEPGAKLSLATHLVVREDELTLYGFARPIELEAFRLLLSVTGVGPKVALAMLSTLDVSDLARALSTNDVRAITQAPGVGPKLAQRLCLDLGDKMAAFVFEKRAERMEAGRQTALQNAAREETIEALINLGYGRADARRAADRAAAAADNGADTATLVNAALKILTGSR